MVPKCSYALASYLWHWRYDPDTAGRQITLSATQPTATAVTSSQLYVNMTNVGQEALTEASHAAVPPRCPVSVSARVERLPNDPYLFFR